MLEGRAAQSIDYLLHRRRLFEFQKDSAFEPKQDHGFRYVIPNVSPTTILGKY